MAVASGANVRMSYVAESTQGVTPGSPVMKTMRTIGRALNPQKGILRSPEQQGHRQQQDVRHGFESVAGTLPFPLVLADQDDWIEAAMAGTWTAVTTGSISQAMTVNGPSRAAGSYITDGFFVGQRVATTGFTTPANNNTGRITALTALTMTIAKDGGGTWSVEADAAGRTLSAVGRICKIGKVLKTFTVERGMTDVAKYEVARGVGVNGMTLNFVPDQVVSGTLDLIGLSFAPMSGVTLGSPTPPTSNRVFAAFDGMMFENDVEQSVVTGISLSIANNRGTIPVLGRKTGPALFEGQAAITGRATIVFQDETIYNRWINEVETTIEVQVDDINGTDFHLIRLPRVKYTGGAIDPPQNGPIIQDHTFEALYDSTTATAMLYQRSNT